MKLYAAPLEGITGYIYRNAHHRHYSGIDKYFLPFVSPKIKRGMNHKEQQDVLPEHNAGIPVVPQILTNKAEDFIRVAKLLQDMGYPEINLNLGCPSGTVVSRGRGSGFLKDRDALRRFFEEGMKGLAIGETSSLRISVKTRLGMEDPEEIIPLMEIYNDYPLYEVIVHARVREDYYGRPVNLDAFRQAAAVCRHPICYNGDIFSKEDMIEYKKAFPETDRVMLGRGMIANPQLPEDCRSEGERSPVFDYERFFRFHDDILHGYEAVLSGNKNALFKMKELWSYMYVLFPGQEKIWKRIKKARNLTEYNQAVAALSY